MSDVQAVLEQVREHYLSGYQESILSFSSNYEKSAAEILLELQNREHLPEPYRLYRIDMGSGDTSPATFLEFNHEAHLKFDPIEFSAGSISAMLHPVSWNGVEFKTDTFDPSDELLADWAIKWIDLDENGVPDKFGFEGYIHSITYPEVQDGSMRFSIDFGSAPVDCIYDLFSIFIEMGLENVEMHSNSMLYEN